MGIHRLDRTEARRIAIRAQMLDASRPTDLLAVIRQLTFLQVDPTAVIAPNADLVAWTRLGSTYRPAHLTQALEEDRTLFELNALIRPMSDLGIYRAEMATWPTRQYNQNWMAGNARFARDILERLRTSGPLLSREIPDTSQVPWASSGWTGDRNVTQMLEFLMMQGKVAIAGRQGRQRIWDLADRVYPSNIPVVSADEAERARDLRRLRALGIARAKGTAIPIEPANVGDAGEPATVEGIRGEWRVDPEALGKPFEGRTALLSPFDRLIHDRGRALELFDFEYTLEMYKPKDQRRWGYFALPILHLDQMVGKVDATADRKSSTLQVHAIHEDVGFTRTITKAVQAELDALASWLGLGSVDLQAGARA